MANGVQYPKQPMIVSYLTMPKLTRRFILFYYAILTRSSPNQETATELRAHAARDKCVCWSLPGASCLPLQQLRLQPRSRRHSHRRSSADWVDIADPDYSAAHVVGPICVFHLVSRRPAPVACRSLCLHLLHYTLREARCPVEQAIRLLTALCPGHVGCGSQPLFPRIG